jgi:hypothetical protein
MLYQRERDCLLDDHYQSDTRRERINWYRDRIVAVIKHSMSVFPTSPVRWIGNHFRESARPRHLLLRRVCSVDVSAIHRQMDTWFFHGVGGSHDEAHPAQRPAQLLQRLWRMTHAQHAAVERVRKTRPDKDVRFMSWGEKIMGAEQYQLDE